jgi:Uncharacterized conserved protein
MIAKGKRNMEYLTRKLPFILSAVMALFTGILGFLTAKSYNFIYASMLTSIVIFWLIGFIVREFVSSILKDRKKKEEELKQENIQTIGRDNKSKGNVIDLKADDSKDPVTIELNTDISKNPEVNDFYGDGFSPLEVSKVVRTNVNNDN